jgi:hypothetical protein
MLSEICLKVFLLASTVVAAEPSRALSLVYTPYKNVMFVPKNYYRRRSKVLFLDESENRQPYGRGEIDLTREKVKFDDPDYEFTSPDESRLDSTTLPSGNERFYEPLPRFRSFQTPPYYQGRLPRPYAPSFGFEPFQVPTFPALRNGFYNGVNGWKARSPRVVFPYSSDNSNSLVHTNSHGGPGTIDNVIFRDQNFGLNDVGTEEQGLQDIGSDAFSERGEF